MGIEDAVNRLLNGTADVAGIPEEEQADLPAEAVESEEANSEESLEGAPAEEIEEPELEEVRYDDGTSERVTSEEARLAGLRMADYTRKTQEMAEQRRRLEAELEQAARTRADYMANVQRIQEQLTPQETPRELLHTDPEEYARLETLNQQRRDVAAQLEADRQKALAEQEAYLAHQRNLVLEREKLKIVERIPEWRNPKVKQAEEQEIAQYLLTEEFSPEEIINSFDSRAVKISRKAMLYDQMMANRDKASKKISRVVKKGARSPTQPVTDVDRAEKRLTDTGTVDSAIDLLVSRWNAAGTQT